MNDEEPKWTKIIWPTVWILVVSLLVAIAFILSVLVFQRTRHSPTSRDKNNAMQIRQAIETYYTENRRYPIDRENWEASEFDWEYSNHALMDVLMGAGNLPAKDLNPRRISFFSGKRAKGDGRSGYRDGVVVNVNGGGELFDSWGNHYRVIVDINSDDRIPAPDWAKDQTPIPQGVIVWSPGPDGKDETEDDNITTW